MNITEYRSKHQSAKVSSDIAERWESRIVAQGLHIQGALGADSYLSQYGKGIKAPKLIAFARCAESKGAHEFANRMWAEAYFLETGLRADCSGMTPSTAPANVPAAAVRTAFNYRPQTLSVIDMETAISMLTSGEWVLQEKHDGERTVAEQRTRTVTTGNKHGLATARSLPLPIQQELIAGPDVVCDGEFIKKGMSYVLFDLLVLEGADLRDKTYAERLALLETLADRYSQHVTIVETFRSTSRADIVAKIEDLRAASAEGFVIKRLAATYTAGDQHADAFKVQFRATNSFVVGKRHPSKSSVEIFSLKDGQHVSAGNVTVPASEIDAVREGQIAEVRYLYAYPDTLRLAQATWCGIRDDADPSDCLSSKLRLKAS